MRARRDTASDLDVERRLTVTQTRLGEKTIGDFVKHLASGDVGRLDAKLAKPEPEAREVPVGLEQTAVDDAPDFVDAIAKDEPPVFNGNRCGGAGKVLTVEISDHGRGSGVRVEANSCG
jgi:hypothetical protein